MGWQLLSIIESQSAIYTYTSDENLHYIFSYREESDDMVDKFNRIRSTKQIRHEF